MLALNEGLMFANQVQRYWLGRLPPTLATRMLKDALAKYDLSIVAIIKKVINQNIGCSKMIIINNIAHYIGCSNMPLLYMIWIVMIKMMVNHHSL